MGGIGGFDCIRVHHSYKVLDLLCLACHIVAGGNHITVEAAADLNAVTFNDCGVSALDMVKFTDDLVFVDYCAFCKCHDGFLFVYRGVVAT
jgi:hypothetical protein